MSRGQSFNPNSMDAVIARLMERFDTQDAALARIERKVDEKDAKTEKRLGQLEREKWVNRGLGASGVASALVHLLTK